MRTSAPPLMEIFRSQLQGELLARVLLHTGECTVTELSASLGAPVSTVHREVRRLEQAGLLTSRRVGRTRVVTGNEANPAVRPLRELVLYAFGPKQVVAEEFGSIPGATSVLVFGSWAARYIGQGTGVPGDVDVLVVGDVDRATVYDAADRAQRRLDQPVNVTLVGQERWTEGSEPFLLTLRSRPYLVVLGEVA